MKIGKFITTFASSCLLLFGLINSAQATVLPVATGYEVSYGIDMKSGTSNGSDIQNTFIFEWNNTDFNVDYAYTIAGKGYTQISHIIDFLPSSALLIGYGSGIPGIGDEKDHLYTITSSAFAESAIGLKWSEVFPGVDPNPRVRHSEMISFLIDAAEGDTSALNALTNFVVTEGYQAAFDPAGRFTIGEWTVFTPIPEPTTLALMGLGLAGIGFARKRKQN